jgi:hypothetical protein
MQELKIIGIENGALVVASDAGEHFRLDIDSVLQSRLRQTLSETPHEQRLPPREIQAHIRSGLSAKDVAQMTGTSLEYVQRFEAPILAEREHIIGSALSVSVRVAIDPDPVDDTNNFGTVIKERMIALGASGERWASWKEPEGGWIIKLAFTVDEIDHDARWSFVPKKHTLTPLNAEAVTLSRQGELPTELIPRLRAVGVGENPDNSRFDSGAFTVKAGQTTTGSMELQVEPIPLGRNGTPSVNAPSVTAINRAIDEPDTANNQTADLLEALRRRRGERGSVHHTHEQNRTTAPSLQQTLDVQLNTFNHENDQASAPSASISQQKSSRKQRASMPSWDEIVFGARTDGDLA